MTGNEAPLRHGILTFAATAGITFLLALPLAIDGGGAEIIAFFCPWIVWYSGNTPLVLVTVACRIGLLAGFLAWLRRALNEMRSSYERTISELKARVETLEKMLNTTTKD